jgi:hypothetical protein
MEHISIVLFVIACAMNCVAAAINIRQSRRARKLIESNRDNFARLIAFAAFMSRPESGVPDIVRNLARQALPEDIRIEVSKIGPFSETQH